MFLSRNRWADLSHEQLLIKDATVEMFLKRLICKYVPPYLSSGQLLEVEKNDDYKKDSF